MQHMSLDFQPLFSLPWLGVILAPLALLVLAGLFFRQRGGFIRLLALAALALALVNPVLIDEEREPLKSVVAVVVDRSQSQDLGNRQADTDAALKKVQDELGKLPQFDVRVVEAARSGTTSTRLFQALGGILRDVPPSRVGGAILITDGQVHDIPHNAAALGFTAPLHGLITGKPGEFDRRIRFINAPRFGITTKPQQFVYTVSDEGGSSSGGGTARVQILVNGEVVSEENATLGAETKVDVTLPRAGSNIVEIKTDTLPGEVTGTNNRAVAKVDGIRENLRVLLVSGEPHNGERTWRNLLKSDTSVDLIHFTILRPPEKSDGTLQNELALIPFPTRELFMDKIEDFDLIILDRYQNPQLNIFPMIYYDFITQYVQNGGALLIAAGPEFAGEQSIAGTPLVNALPALPTGAITEKAFYPRLSDLGKRHPVTRGLEGGGQEPPQWSRWFRAIDVSQPQGEVVMNGPDNKPLLVLNRVGEGRVGMFLSDQGWLWARGFEGGGPYAALYRRIAHWLMQEPQLEEEALNASDNGNALQIRRQTLGDKPGNATVITPSGKTVEVPLKQSEPGIFSGTLETDEIGLFQVANGDLNTLAHVGPVDAPEFADSVSTVARLEPLAAETGGSVRRLHQQADQAEIETPGIIAVRETGAASGNSWIGLRETGDTALKSVHSIPLFSGFLALAAMLLVLGGMWYREGR